MPGFLKEQRLNCLAPTSLEYFQVQKDLIRQRPLLHHCYTDWYGRLQMDIESVKQPGEILELGSGGSLLKDVLPGVITSDVIAGVADRVIDARELPFPDSSVKAIVLTHVFHHIPDVAKFLAEARRVLVPGGVITMIEVAHTPFAKFFFSRFHPEPYRDDARAWSFSQNDSMLDSNQALSWIVFVRDHEKFQREFPEFKIETIAFTPWMSYLISRGVTKKNIIPSFSVNFFLALDRAAQKLSPLMSLHWHFCLRKNLHTTLQAE